MTFLLTGSSGFVGGHLAAELASRGHYVYGVDRNPGRRTDTVADLLEPGVFARLLANVRPEMVVHLAAQVGRLFGEDNVRRTVRSNSELTALIAAECGRRGVRLGYVSSSEVYGNRGDAVCVEDGPMALPHNVYGLTKRHGEEFAALYTDDPMVFRLSMPYGPGVPPGRGRRAMDTMLWQAHHRMPLTVHRGSERSWCWIGDTVRGIRMILEGGQGGAWNVGRDDNPVSMLNLAVRCCELADAPADLIELVDPPSAQTIVKRLSTDKLRSIGWEPLVSLEDGMAGVFRWVRNFDRDGKPGVIDRDAVSV